MSKQAYKFRLYPTRKQIALLQETLDRCRELYNACLQERRDAYRMAGKSITYYDQARQLPEIKEIREEYHDIHSQVLQDVLRRADKTFKAFFLRLKRGETPGYPRFKSRTTFDSFCYPQVGFSLTHDHRLCLSKIGSIKVRLHRPLKGTIKTCTIKLEVDQWYVVLVCEVDVDEELPLSCEEVGIDLGVTHLATLSTGETIEHPRHYRRAEQKMKHLRQSLARKKRGSHRRQRAKKVLSRAYRKVRNQRQDYLHKASRQLVNRFRVIVFEELEAANLVKRPKPKQDEATGEYLPNGAAAKGGLNKSILDAGWGQFQQYCSYKAAKAGRVVLFVNPKYTSQMCSGCGAIRQKELSERWHSCECGTEMDRDRNAAVNILRLGRSQRGSHPVEAPGF